MAKAKPTLNLVSQAVASSSTVPSSHASNRLRILRAPSQQDSNLKAKKVQGNLPLEVHAASSSQVWQSDVKSNNSEKRLAAAKRLASENSDVIDDDPEWPSNYHKYRAYVPHLVRVCSNLRQKLGRKPVFSSDLAR